MSQKYKDNIKKERNIKLRQLISQLPDLCGDFLRSISTTSSELTRIAYALDYIIFFEFAIKEIPRFANRKLYEFDDDDIASFTAKEFDIFIDYLRYYIKEVEDNNSNTIIEKTYQNNENGIMRKLSSLRSLFGYLFRMERIPGNTAEMVPLPKLSSKPIIFLDDDEVKNMMEVILDGKSLSESQKKFNNITRHRDYAMIMLFLGTGMRISECIGINIDDIDFKINAVLVTRKGGNSEILYFPSQVSDALMNYYNIRKDIEAEKGHENAFFLSLQRKRISARAVQKLVKKYANIAAPLKKRISPHKLRSTFATNLYKNTGDIYLVADALGHADVNTTRKHYAAISEEHKKRAARDIVIPGAIDDIENI